MTQAPSPSPAAKLHGLWLTLASSCLGALFLVSYKLASSYGEVSDMVFWLLLIAALFSSATSSVQARGLGWVATDKLSASLSLALAILTLVGNLCSAQAIVRISPALTSVFQQTQVLFVAFLGLAFLGEKVSLRFWLGTVIAAFGVWLMRGPDQAELRLDLVGALFASGSALAFAGMVVLTRKYVHRINPLSVNAQRLWLASLLWLVFERRLPDLERGLPFIALCALCALVGPFLSRVTLMYALKYLPANRVTLLSLSTPVITLAPAYWVFGSVPLPREWLGSAVILLGVAWPLLEQGSPRSTE